MYMYVCEYVDKYVFCACIYMSVYIYIYLEC